MDAAERQKANLWKMVVWGLSAVIGVPALLYAGNVALVPVIVLIVLTWVGDKVLKPSKPLALSIYLQMADVLALAMVLVVPDVTGKVAIGVYVILAGAILFWLARHPSIVAAVLMTVLQIGFSIGVFESFMTAGYGTRTHKMAVVHLAARLLGLILMYVGLYEIATRPAQPEVPEKDQMPDPSQS